MPHGATWDPMLLDKKTGVDACDWMHFLNSLFVTYMWGCCTSEAGNAFALNGSKFSLWHLRVQQFPPSALHRVRFSVKCWVQYIGSFNSLFSITSTLEVVCSPRSRGRNWQLLDLSHYPIHPRRYIGFLSGTSKTSVSFFVLFATDRRHLQRRIFRWRGIQAGSTV